MRSADVFALGEEATKDTFLGRSVEMQFLRSRLCDSKSPCRLSVTGISLVGKSSLIHKFELEELGQLTNILTVSTTMYATNAVDFFRGIFDKMKESIQSNANLKDTLLDAAVAEMDKVDFSQEDTYFYPYMHILDKILKRVHTLKFKVVLSIDGYDNAAEVFKDKRQYFALLKEMTCNQYYNVSLIVISRQQADMIEQEAIPNAKNYAPLYARLEPFHVNDFSNDDMVEYYQRLQEFVPSLTPSLEQKLEHYAGRNPYLLSYFGREIVKRSREPQSVDETALQEIREAGRHTITNYYNILRQHLEDIQCLNKLLAVLFEGNWERDEALYTLQDLHYLDEGKTSICPDFMEYLKGIYSPGQ